jgi:hypothetical protein
MIVLEVRLALITLGCGPCFCRFEISGRQPLRYQCFDGCHQHAFAAGTRNRSQIAGFHQTIGAPQITVGENLGRHIDIRHQGPGRKRTFLKHLIYVGISSLAAQ